MNWLVIGTLRRGAMEKPELLGEEDSLEATRSLVQEKELGDRGWTTRWHEITREEQYA
jgi:hypothetical protein